MTLVIDNYDSFTYNLVQYLAELGDDEPEVYRNDEISVEEVAAKEPERVVISPGPGVPERAGITIDVIRRLGPRLPILGVCLGHQAIAAAFGGRIERASELMHGKTSEIRHFGTPLFAGVESPFTATRYHSLIVDRDTLPDCLEVTAETGAGLIMGLRHKEYPIEGVQFHPESILTPRGKLILANFLKISGKEGARSGWK